MQDRDAKQNRNATGVARRAEEEKGASDCRKNTPPRVADVTVCQQSTPASRGFVLCVPSTKCQGPVAIVPPPAMYPASICQRSRRWEAQVPRSCHVRRCVGGDQQPIAVESADAGFAGGWCVGAQELDAYLGKTPLHRASVLRRRRPSTRQATRSGA